MFPAKIHRIIYIVLVTLLGGCMVCSTWASNLVWVLMGANWVLEGRWREKWQMAKDSRLLQAYLAVYVTLLVGMLWTHNTAAGWSVIQVALPLAVVPLVMLTTRPLGGRLRHVVLWLYCGTVLVVSAIAAVRMAVMPDLPYRQAVPYISHIRFALNCCMVIFIMVGNVVTRRSRQLVYSVVQMLVAVWMLVFLVLIHSYTAIAVLAVVSLVVMLVHYRRPLPIALWLLLFVGTAALVGREVHSYYRMVPLAAQPLQSHTAAGRPYFHACDGVIENGNFVNNYICREELRSEWQRRSPLPYDTLTASGYSVESTLVRYLNAMGATKDSAGVAMMSAGDVEAVERGVANPIYECGNPLRKMVYVMLLEREYYVHTHAVAGFTMLQRLELWKATWHVVREHPWLGVGTGDAVDAMHAELADMDSELTGTTKKSHNQYLTLLAMVGFLGFGVIVVMFLRAAIKSPRRSALMLAWVLAILISFLTEDTLDTLAGILFCTWFLAFRYRIE